MQNSKLEIPTITAQSKDEKKMTLFGSAGFLVPLLFTTQAGAAIMLFQQIEHQTMGATAALASILAITIVMTFGQDTEEFVRRRFRRKAAAAA